jgi:hypothetical protein
MDRCRLLVEGQTEETFANRTLVPYLYSLGFHDVSITLVTTKRIASGGKFRGGVTSWAHLRKDLGLLIRDAGALVTTIVDFYGLPADVPGMATIPRTSNPRERVRHVEREIATAVSAPNLLPHVVLHELEALLYTDPSVVAAHFGDDQITVGMTLDVTECGEPEFVDDGPDTAPSKRILGHRSDYVKTSDGPTILEDIGLNAIRAACPHFDAWLSDIESLAP